MRGAMTKGKDDGMRITVAESAGFCFGVKRAIRIALETAGKGDSVEMLGDIVHNENVVEQVEHAGIVKIEKLGDGKGKTLLIRAHGAARQVFAEAVKRGYRIVDATCPMVKEIHTIAADFDRRGLRVIIIGDEDHDEVQGICGQIDAPALIVDDVEHIPWQAVAGIEQAGVVVQSTKREETVQAIVEALRPKFKQLEVCNTICQATIKRQQEIKLLPKHNDVVLVIGSRSSANTKRLYEIARELNPRTHWIQSEGDVDLAWFDAAATIGITAGASTPRKTIDEVVRFLEESFCRPTG